MILPEVNSVATNYWRVKSAALERQMRLEQLNAEAAKVDAAYKAVMVAEGLDPAKNYRLDDATEAVIEQDAPKQP